MYCNACGAALPNAAARFCPSCGHRLENAPTVVVRKSMSPVWIILIVLAIGAVPVLGILLAIAIPAYQDYTMRAQVAEGLNAAAPLKMSIEEYAISSSGRLPSSGAELGASVAPHPRLRSLEVEDEGVITLVYAAPEQIAGRSVILTPQMQDGTLTWSCNGAAGFGARGTIENRWLPRSCRMP